MGEATFLQDLVAGTIGGCCGIVVGQPMDTVKVRMQTTAGLYTGIADCAATTVRNEGPRALFKGILAPLLANAPINATLFVVNGAMVRYMMQRQRFDDSHTETSGSKLGLELASRLREEGLLSEALEVETAILKLAAVRVRNRTLDRETPSELQPHHHFVAGAVGGLAQAVFACPNELIKIQQQVGKGHYTDEVSAAQVARRQVQRLGVVRGLFQGMGLTLARDMPAFGVYFSSYEMTKEHLKQSRQWDLTSSSFVAGGIAGMLSFLLLHPVDVVKSCRQMQDASTPKLDTALLSIVRAGLREDGYRYFFRGVGASVLRAAPVSAVIFVVYEQILLLMQGS